MEAKELRIGNYVNFKFHKDCGGVKGIEVFVSDLEIILQNNSKSEYYTPIPLTEGWLVKFGFTCFWDDDYDNNVFSLIRSGNYDDVIIDPSWVSQTECNRFVIAHFDYEMDLEIKHVHQLQNLYFALTNEELTIK
tara:strand:- start:197 stop:601 length:405 start_codon:yes stop_codon:yes gene_type:complete